MVGGVDDGGARRASRWSSDENDESGDEEEKEQGDEGEVERGEGRNGGKGGGEGNGRRRRWLDQRNEGRAEYARGKPF